METEPSRVLVGIDESISADAAIEVGMLLSDLYDGSLQLLHAVPIEPPVLPDLASASWQDLRETALQRAFAARAAHLEQVFERTRWKGADVHELLRVVHGRPAAALLEQAAASVCDVIVLGGSRQRPDEMLDLGSTARTVLGKSDCPVWVQAAEVRRIRDILVPVDMSPHSRHTLDTAIDLARRLDASVQILHVHTPHHEVYPLEASLVPRASAGELRDAEQRAFHDFVARVDGGGVEIEAEFREGRPIQSVLESQQRADLIVVGTHGRTAFARAILGTLAWEILRRADRGVLAVPGPGLSYRHASNTC